MFRPPVAQRATADNLRSGQTNGPIWPSMCSVVEQQSLFFKCSVGRASDVERVTTMCRTSTE
eukprot:2584507-Heterocapsa_arctica.AAC.1